MTLELLKLYCDVVRLHSFSQGAAANQISQSAASQAIQQLEAELQVRLIDRSKRPFMMTPEGRTFYEGCQSLLQGFEKVRSRIASPQTQITGDVRVAAIYSVGIHIMSDHMQRFMTQYQQAKVRLEYLHPHKVVEAVLNDQADLGILSYPPANRSLMPTVEDFSLISCKIVLASVLIASRGRDHERYGSWPERRAERKARWMRGRRK